MGLLKKHMTHGSKQRNWHHDELNDGSTDLFHYLCNNPDLLDCTRGMARMRISWSAAQMFKQCSKRYAYKHIDHKPEPPQPHFEHGNRIHSDIEHALKNIYQYDKPAFPPVAHVNWAVDLVAGEQPVKVQVEEWVNADVEGIHVAGKADCIIESANGTAVIDWKTAKKNKTSLEDNVRDQLHLYGSMLHLTSKDKVVAAYPEHKRMFPVSYDPEHGKRVFDDIIETGHVIEEFKSIVTTADEVEGTTQFLCQWCSFRNECPDSNTKKAR